MNWQIKRKRQLHLQHQIENGKNERKLAITEAVNVKEKEIAQKIEEINKLKEAFSAKEREKDREIEQLKSQIEGSETVKKLAISEAINKKDIEKQNMLESKQEELTEKNRIIEALKAKIANGELKENQRYQRLFRKRKKKFRKE